MTTDTPAGRWDSLRAEVQDLQRLYQAAYEADTRPESQRTIAAGYIDAFVMVLGRMEALEHGRPAATPGGATCDAEHPGVPSAPGGYPWMCTATPGHAGDHAERDEDGKILARWPQAPEGGPRP